MIPVTKPFLPPINDYQNFIQEIWSRNWLTNNGPLVTKLEEQLASYLKVTNPLFLSNGTIALQIAIKALGLKDEIITTPFSYVATTSSIVWENCTPVFVDIDINTCNINPEKIEDAITTKTTAILATHCFGNPCAIDAIEKIAKKYDLKVIYDAAHCFGTTYKNKSVFTYGDISTTSFHATKLFHSVEGGAVFTNNIKLKKRMSYMRNFGHNGPEKFHGIGINGKNSEFHAAMGLVNLKYVDEILLSRKKQFHLYKKLLNHNYITFIKTESKSVQNYSYCPVIFENEEINLKVIKSLLQNDIIPRRYFYPSLSSLDYVNYNNTPISDDISKRILCLPLFYDLKNIEIIKITEIINQTISDYH